MRCSKDAVPGIRPLFSDDLSLYSQSSRLFVLTFAIFQLCNSVQIDEVITWAVFFCVDSGSVM